MTRSRSTTMFPALLVIMALLASACSAAGGTTNRAPAPADTAEAASHERAMLTNAGSPTSAAVAKPAPEDVLSMRTRQPVNRHCPADTNIADQADTVPVPAELRRAMRRHISSEALNGVEMSASIWVEGYGEVVSREPDLALLPASNQKLVTAIGVAELLDLDDRFRTAVYADGNDLVLVAGGDPTLTVRDVGELASAVATEGTVRIDRLVVDAGRFSADTVAPGWQDWHMPRYVGPLSAFMVDNNRYRDDAAFLADPALGNAQLFAEHLRALDVSVRTVVRRDDHERSAEARAVASTESVTFGELVEELLASSDNQHADLLVSEIGARHSDGSIAAGTRKIHAVLGAWCLDLEGESGDGSGLSRTNWRSADEFRRLLAAAQDEEWGVWFEEALPVAGRTGTLSRRFRGTPAEGQVRAKTGTIIGGVSLSGYATTVDGRDVVFSIIVNSAEPALASAARPAIDALLIDLIALG